MNESKQNNRLEEIKCVILNNVGEPKHIFVFNSPDNSTKLHDLTFEESEKLYLEKFNPTVSNSNQFIHQDDTIRTIKRKLLKEVDFENDSYETVYLFSKMDYKINFQKHFHFLKKNNSGLNKQQLGQLIFNLMLTDKEKHIQVLNSKNKSIYSYKDIESELQLDQQVFEICIPIGHKFDSHDDLLFSANPFHQLPNNQLIEKNNNNIFLTFENSLLLSYQNIKNNTLYVCFADDVLNYCNTYQINQKNVIEMYYPFLFNKSVFSLSDLNSNKINLITDSKNKFEKISDEQIDTLYKISNEQTSNINYLNKGIYEISLTFHPETKVQLPLENIFKQLHSTKDRPFIKFKPGFKKEELYRLYSTGISNSGQKIPFLKKSQINQFTKITHSYQKYILIACQKYINDSILNIIFIVNKNGSINTNIKFLEPNKIQNIESLITDTLNPIIIEINFFLQQTNKLDFFENLQSKNIEITKINYTSSVYSKTGFKAADLKLLSPVFNILEIGNKNVSSLRYKRVENYTEMNEMNAQINQMYKQNLDVDSIRNLISINFSLSEEEAFANITKYLNECTRINGTFINKNIDIADNPGFASLLSYKDIENEITFEIYDINSFQYIPVIEVYIDSFLKLVQYKKELNINKAELENLKKKEKKTDDVVENLVVTQFNNDELSFTDGQDEMEGIFFDDDDDDEEEELEEQEEEGMILPSENISPEEEDFENDSEEEEDKVILADDSDDDEDGGFLSGGAKTDKGSGTRFFNKLKRLEPTIFVNETDGAYAKICPAQSNRQPVILTQEEKDLIDQDEESKNAYGIAIKYGSNPDKPYWYMCPRYWCLKTNKPMTEEQVKNGECGGKIIPKNKKTNVPEGYYIYEFTDDRQHIDKDGNYIYYNPGFLSQDKSSKNIGVPCCFKNPFGAKQNQRREELNISKEDIDYGNENLIYGEKTEKNKVERNYQNILSTERIPVPQNRWGFIPLSIELFLQIDNSKYIDSTNETYIKKNTYPLLRCGVEKSSKQSFIACIADLYADKNNTSVPSINEMKKIISKNISLDKFVNLQNGNLLSLFQTQKINVSDMNVEKYRNTDYYKKLDLSKQSQNNLLKSSISSYTNFINFLKDEDSVIDHTFLWDVVCSKNSGLFEGGLNLVIMEIEDKDKRDSVSLICPTNFYSDLLYDEDKGTVLILKQFDYYEPIYVYGNTKTEKSSNKESAKKIFYRENTPINLLNVFKNIKNSINSYCKPKHNSKIYKFKDNLSANMLFDELMNINLVVHKQIMNYRNKIIGLMVSQLDDSMQIFIPCRPSTHINEIELDFIDNVKWNDYSNTLGMLNMISNKSNGKILCKPITKLEEDGLIVGIITETNQFISISEPQQNLSEDGLDVVQSNSFKNYYEIDKELAVGTIGDRKRLIKTRNVKLETKFYLQFRHKLKDELINPLNSEFLENIEHIAKSKDFVYEIKMNKIDLLIKDLISSSVRFIEFDNETLDILFEKSDMDYHNQHGLCLHSDNTLCLPNKNLITGEENETMYYLRMTDEIIRNTRIQNYLFNSSFMKIVNVDYSVLDSELLVLDSNINDDDFFNYQEITENKYIRNIPFEQVFSENKSKKISLENQDTNNVYKDFSSVEKECIKSNNKLTDKNNWKNIFDTNAQEMVLQGSPYCNYFALIYILKKVKNVEENISFIKNTLIKAYKELISDPKCSLAIQNILKKQDKKLYVNKIIKKQLSYDSMILNENYNLTHLDIWVFCNYMNLPVILFSDISDKSSHMKIYSDMQVKTNHIVLGGDVETDSFIFLKSNHIQNGDIHFISFSIITPGLKINEINNLTIIKKDLKETLQSFKVKLKIKNELPK